MQAVIAVLIACYLWIGSNANFDIESKNNASNESRYLRAKKHEISDKLDEKKDFSQRSFLEDAFHHQNVDLPRSLDQKSGKQKVNEIASSKSKQTQPATMGNPFAAKGFGHHSPPQIIPSRGSQLATSNDSVWKTTPLVNNEGKQINLLYIKVSKVGSSTVGGIIRRIAHHHGISGWDTNLAKEQFGDDSADGGNPKIEEPAVYANHGHMESEEDILSSLRLPFHLITWVRDPVDRCLSSYYHFGLTRHSDSPKPAQESHRLLKKKDEDSKRNDKGNKNRDDAEDEDVTETKQDAQKLHYMAGNACKNFQFNYIATKKMKSIAVNPDDADEAIGKRQKSSAKSKVGLPANVIDNVLREIFKTYDFIGSTSKFDESTLLLAWQLNLTMCDVLYLKSKDSLEGRKDDRTNHFVVPHPPLQNESAVVQAYARSTEFRVANQLDYELVDAVEMRLKNLQMRLTQRNEALFNHVLGRYKYYLTVAKERCYPHSNSAANLKDLTECYWNDNGCGYPCLNEVCRSHPELMQKLSSFT